MKKRLLTLFISFTFVFTVILNSSSALAYSKNPIVPSLIMITQPAAEYHPGERVSFTVSSPNYKGAVQYRVILYNGTTKKTSELWPGYPGYYYTKWQPSGNYNFKINWPVQGMEPGAYSLTVLVRRAGAKVPYDSYVNTTAFWIKDNSSTTDNTNTTSPSSDNSLDTKEIAKKYTSVLLLKCYDKNGELLGTGSGFLVSADGKIITNFHVIEDVSSIKAIAYDEKEYEVEGVLNYSIERDIAILSVKGLNSIPCLTLGDSDKLELGESIVAIGNPMGLQNTVSTGIISSFRNNVIRNADGTKDIQISAPISPGSSGGPLFNSKGDVVGITYAGYTEVGQNLNFAIPINEAKDMLKTSNFKTLSQLLSIIPNSAEQIKTIKNYSYIADYYNNLSELGDCISSLNTTLEMLAYDIIYNDDLSYLQETTDGLNNIKDVYNTLAGEASSIISQAKKENIDTSDINSIIDNYSHSIDYYKTALNSLKKYANSNSNSDIKDYINSMAQGANLAKKTMKSCEDDYMKFYDKIKLISSADKDVNIIRLYSMISTYYKLLRSYGYSISQIDNDIYFSHILIKENFKSDNIDQIKKELSYVDDFYSKLSSATKEMVSVTKETGIDLSDMNTIITNYSSAIECYKSALAELIKYKSSKSDACIDKLTDITSKGYSLASAAKKAAMQGYDKYYKLVQDY